MIGSEYLMLWKDKGLQYGQYRILQRSFIQVIQEIPMTKRDRDSGNQQYLHDWIEEVCSLYKSITSWKIQRTFLKLVHQPDARFGH